MSGHSKWHNIQKRKGAQDQKRAANFGKLAKSITVAAKEGGGDPSFNFSLRMAIDAAKAENMPKDNIERAIARGTGEGGEGALEEVVYEGFGPGGVAVLIQCLTDNRNRTVADIKYLVSKNGGNIGAQGSVMWMFDRKGVVSVPADSIEDKDAFELAAIEAGAEEIDEDDGLVRVVSSVQGLKAVAEAVEALGAKVEGAELAYLPTQTAEVADADRGKLDAFLEAVEDNDDVDRVFTNEG